MGILESLLIKILGPSKHQEVVKLYTMRLALVNISLLISSIVTLVDLFQEQSKFSDLTLSDLNFESVKFIIAGWIGGIQLLLFFFHAALFTLRPPPTNLKYKSLLDEWLQIYGLYKYQDKDYEQSTDFDKDEIVFYLRYGGRNIDYVLYFSTFLALLHLTYLVVFDNVYSVWYIFRIGLVIIGLTVITDLVDYMKNKELYTDLSKLENDIYNDDFLSEYFDEGKAVDLLYMACLRDHVWEFLVNHGKEIREVELNVDKENEFGLGMDDSAVNIKYHPFSEKLDIHISELRSNSPVLIKSNTGRYARLD